MRDTTLLVNEKDITQCAGLSKMTYKEETQDGLGYYTHFKFVEFLEMIAQGGVHFRFTGNGFKNVFVSYPLFLRQRDRKEKKG